MILPLILLATMHHTAHKAHKKHTPKADPRELKVTEYLLKVTDDLAGEMVMYPVLFDKFVDPIIDDISKLANEKVADPTFRDDFDKLGADLDSLHTAEKLLDSKQFPLEI